MEVKCTKGFWNVKPETGEIRSNIYSNPLAVVYGPSRIDKKDRSIKEYISNAAIMTESSEMYSLLLVIKGAIQLLYHSCPEDKDDIWDYVEERIAKIERQIQEIIEHGPDKS